MLTYILRRAGQGATVILATLVATFTLFFAGPSDPALAMCSDRQCPPEKLARITENLGLDKPFAAQFGDYFTGLFVGRDFTVAGDTVHCSAPCLGMSFRTNRPVTGEILSRFPATLLLTLGAVLVFLLVGVGLGILAATGTRARDRLVIGLSQVFGAIPYYVVALIFALYSTRFFGILPQAVSMSEGFFAFLPGLIAPCLILGLVTSTGYTRYTRNSMHETLSMDYVRTARSKGISERSVVVNHALRGALGPVMTILGLDVAALLSGTIITEKIFEVDGIGRLSIDSLAGDDLPVIMGCVLVASFFVVVMNLVVDIAYSVLDPRVRLA